MDDYGISINERVNKMNYKSQLSKQKGKDFIVLNLTDPQLSDEEWKDGHPNRKILEYTVSELIRRCRPDLITVSGDIAWAGNEYAYDMFADFIEGFQIPWAPVWGNHDNQGGPELLEWVATGYMQRKHCLFDKGDPALGNGNYVVAIVENGALITGILLMDTHDRENYVDADGREYEAWSKLTDSQVEWYKEQISRLKEKGCKDAVLITHIPIYAYRKASACAYKDSSNLKELTPKQASGHDCWKVGYEESIGVQHEAISSFPLEDGVFEVVKEMGLTKHVLAGHDHINNWIIRYEGVRLIFALKTGAGCYWEPILNGGTVIKVGESGVKDVYHEYVDVSHML